MRKLIAIIILLSPMILSAQVVRWETFQQSISANDADTTWYAFRPSGGQKVNPDSLAINPPDKVEFDGEPAITFRLVSGTSADSVISYAKQIDFAGRIITGDSSFVLGATFAAPSSPNTFGDGRLYGKTPIFNTKRYNGFIVITKLFDLSGGVRKFEWGFGTR
jgi:hypothetical protein